MPESLPPDTSHEDPVVRLEGQLRDALAKLQAAERDAEISKMRSMLHETSRALALHELDAVKESESYKLGKAILWPLRAAKTWWERRNPGNGLVSLPGTAHNLGEEIELAEAAAAEAKASLEALAYRPKISLIVPIRGASAKSLREMLASVERQRSPDWELCLCDDGKGQPDSDSLLDEARQRDPERVRVTRHTGSGGFAEAVNDAARLATGEFLGFLAPGDLLSPWAVLEVQKHLAAHPETDLLYSDEDKLTAGGGFVDAFHKPGFAPQMLLSCNYVGHLLILRRSLFEELGGMSGIPTGGEEYDLVLRATERARRIGHIPRVLYHRRPQAAQHTGRRDADTGEGGRLALEVAMRRRGWTGTVERGLVPGTHRVRVAVPPGERVSIVIPTKDGLALLKQCVESIHAVTEYRDFEILVLSNNSREEATYRWLDAEQEQGRLRWKRCDYPFNFARLMNDGAAATTSPHLLLLNNDVKPLRPDWLRALLEWSVLPEVGAVGALLRFPDGTVQHSGVLLGICGAAGHAHYRFPSTSLGYFGSLGIVRNYSAVTAACLMVRRDVYEVVGGMDERFQVAYNDVDFCLRVREAGYRLVYTPYSELCHYEKTTRGHDNTPEKRRIYMDEFAMLVCRWRDALYTDPFYNPNLTMVRENFAPKTPWDLSRELEFRNAIATALGHMAHEGDIKPAVTEALAPQLFVETGEKKE